MVKFGVSIEFMIQTRGTLDPPRSRAFDVLLHIAVTRENSRPGRVPYNGPHLAS